MTPGERTTIVCMVVVLLVRAAVAGPGKSRSRKCWSKTASKYMNARCEQQCDAGNECPIYCTCIDADTDGDMCTPPTNEKLVMFETMMPESVLFTIPVTGEEKWEFSLSQTAQVHGPTLAGLSSYFELVKNGNSYEMIVKKVPDLEQIAKDYRIDLSSLSIVLRCVREGMTDQSFDVFLEVKQVNEFAPEFSSTPIYRLIPENTPVGSEVLCLNHYATDKDVNTETTELAKFGVWSYLLDAKHDGKEYLEMPNRQNGSLFLFKPLDYEQLRADDLLLFFLNVSASDVHGRTAWTTLTFEIGDVDDLPPEFYHPGCRREVIRTKPCLVSYVAKVDFNFVGVVTEIKPKQISARDMDNMGNTILFSLETAPGQEAEATKMFELEAQTGELTVVTPFSTRGTIDLVVVATENSSLRRTTQAPLKILVGHGTTEPPLKTGNVEAGGKVGQDGSKPTTTVTKDDDDNTMLILVVLGFGSLLLLSIAICLFALIKHKSTSRSPDSPPPYPTGNNDTAPTSYHMSRNESDLRALSTARKDLAPDSPSTLMEMRSSADMTSDMEDHLPRDTLPSQNSSSDQHGNRHVMTFSRRPGTVSKQENDIGVAGAEDVDILAISRPSTGPTEGSDESDGVTRSISSPLSLQSKNTYLDNDHVYSDELGLGQNDIIRVPVIGFRELGLPSPEVSLSDLRVNKENSVPGTGSETHLGLGQDDIIRVPEIGFRELGLPSTEVSLSDLRVNTKNSVQGTGNETHLDTNGNLPQNNEEQESMVINLKSDNKDDKCLNIQKISHTDSVISDVVPTENKDTMHSNIRNIGHITPDVDAHGKGEYANNDQQIQLPEQVNCYGGGITCLPDKHLPQEMDAVSNKSLSRVPSVQEEVKRRLSLGRLEQINLNGKRPSTGNAKLKSAAVRSYNLVRDAGPLGYSHLGYRTADISLRRTSSCRTRRDNVKTDVCEPTRPVTSYAELYSRNRCGGELSRQFPAMSFDRYKTGLGQKNPTEDPYTSPWPECYGVSRQNSYQTTSELDMVDSQYLRIGDAVSDVSTTTVQQIRSKPVPIDRWHRQPYMLLNHQRLLQQKQQQEEKQQEQQQQQQQQHEEIQKQQLQQQQQQKNQKKRYRRKQEKRQQDHSQQKRRIEQRCQENNQETLTPSDIASSSEHRSNQVLNPQGDLGEAVGSVLEKSSDNKMIDTATPNGREDKEECERGDITGGELSDRLRKTQNINTLKDIDKSSVPDHFNITPNGYTKTNNASCQMSNYMSRISTSSASDETAAASASLSRGVGGSTHESPDTPEEIQNNVEYSK